MSILKKILKRSNVADIRIKYKDENINFNLIDELRIDEFKINQEITEQPSYYGFLSLLAVKLKRTLADNKAKLEKHKGTLFTDLKGEYDPLTNKPFSNDYIDAMIVKDSEYQSYLKAYNKADEEYGIISSAVESFQQRATLLQSLSANIRKDKDTH